jgi:hypothetical protein
MGWRWMREDMRRHNDRKVGGLRAPKLWRLVQVGIASRIVRQRINARAQRKAGEVVWKIARLVISYTA